MNTTDLFSTIAALAGVNVDRINDSESLVGLLDDGDSGNRFFHYTEKAVEDDYEWAVSDGIFKLIEAEAGSLELFNLSEDPFESINLLQTGEEPEGVVDDFQFLVDSIRN